MKMTGTECKQPELMGFILPDLTYLKCWAFSLKLKNFWSLVCPTVWDLIASKLSPGVPVYL